LRRAFETRSGGEWSGRHDEVAGPTGQCDTREHWVRRADTGEKRRARRVQIFGVVKAPVTVRNALRWVGPHPERSGFVMCCSKPVAIVLNDLHGLPIGENVCHLLHGRIHGAPEFLIAWCLREQD
jgi:hypothetical protein